MISLRLPAVLVILLPVLYNSLHAQWTQTADLNGGEVYCFAVSDSNLFAGTFGGGVFRSTDNGSQWESVNSGLVNMNVRALAVRGSMIFAGTSGGGIFLSTNRGNSWCAINNGLTTAYIQGITVVDTILYTATQGHGIFRSTDNGAHWQPMNNGLTNGNVRTIIAKGSDLYAGIYSGGVFRSTDGGMHWHEINNGLTNLSTKDIAVIGENLFVASHGGGVFRSTDNGGSWNSVNDGLPDVFVRTFVVHGTELYAGIDASGIFRSTDYGSTWTDENSGLTNSIFFSLFIHNSMFFAGSYSGDIWIKNLQNTNNKIYQPFTVEKGWNLVSTPLRTDSPSSDSIFKNSEAVFQYDNISLSYFLSMNIELGKGYWAYYFEPETLSFSGIAVDSIGINISKEGWVLIGSRTISSPVSSLVSIPNGSISGDIFRFNSSLQHYHSATDINSGEGYWVYVTQPCTLKLQNN